MLQVHIGGRGRSDLAATQVDFHARPVCFVLQAAGDNRRHLSGAMLVRFNDNRMSNRLAIRYQWRRKAYVDKVGICQSRTLATCLQA